ncbi:hypothetical protein GCM10010377_47830 [Streptomyces viridiviolaceus]|nr:hypothetical protein GCM10010377_47830 [Streptomyces viridiviolaceus]
MSPSPSRTLNQPWDEGATQGEQRFVDVVVDIPADSQAPEVVQERAEPSTGKAMLKACGSAQRGVKLRPAYDCA